MLRLINTIVQYWNRIDPSWRFAIRLFVAVRLFYAVWSWAIFTIQPLAVQNIELSNEPILTVFNLVDDKAYTYLREIDGQVLTFQMASPAMVRDFQTGSIWDISTGTALAGPEKGSTLSPSKTPPSAIFPHLNLKP